MTFQEAMMLGLERYRKKKAEADSTTSPAATCETAPKFGGPSLSDGLGETDPNSFSSASVDDGPNGHEAWNDIMTTPETDTPPTLIALRNHIAQVLSAEQLGAVSAWLALESLESDTPEIYELSQMIAVMAEAKPMEQRRVG